jgi:hypothetical protein
MQSLNLSVSSILQRGVKPQPSSKSSAVDRETNLARVKTKGLIDYLEESRPNCWERIACEVPSIGSHNREIGGKICWARYHS